MRRLVALGGALLLTLALAAPAAANQRVYIDELSGPYEWESAITDFGWACSEPVYIGGYGTSDLWLWYGNDVDVTKKAEYMPDGRAWPWIDALTKDRGVVYASTGADMTGTVISTKTASTTRGYDHHLGDPYPFDVRNPDGIDLETWRYSVEGLTFSLRGPGGVIYHEAGHGTGTATVIEQNHQPEGDEVAYESDPNGPHGTSRWNDPKLCEALGLEYVAPIGD
jgi:hypothetical protein